jgi:hypothetical protein
MGRVENDGLPKAKINVAERRMGYLCPNDQRGHEVLCLSIRETQYKTILRVIGLGHITITLPFGDGVCSRKLNT